MALVALSVSALAALALRRRQSGPLRRRHALAEDVREGGAEDGARAGEDGRSSRLPRLARACARPRPRGASASDLWDAGRWIRGGPEGASG